MSNIETDGLSVTYSADRTGSPDLRLIHYNDVYHVEYALISPSFLSCCLYKLQIRVMLNYVIIDPALQSPSAGCLGSNPL